MKTVSGILTAIIFAMATVSCSTTRVLQEDQYRLSDNNIKVTNDRKFNTASLTPYLKQKPNPSVIFGWNPFLSVYNWSNGKGKGWDRFVQKIGQAPVIYDADLVESTVENIESHLEYQGYYGSSVDTDIKVRKKKGGGIIQCNFRKALSHQLDRIHPAGKGRVQGSIPERHVQPLCKGRGLPVGSFS